MLAFTLMTLLLLVLAYKARCEGCLTPFWRLVISVATFIVGGIWVWYGITLLR